MAPMKNRIEKEGGKKKEMITVEVKTMDLHREQQQEVMGISSGEEGEKDGDIPLFK
jgi:hypothetical protein